MDINSLRADVILHNLQTSVSNSSLLSQNFTTPSLSTVFGTVILLLLTLFILWILRIIFTIKHSLQESSVILELTPPANSEKTSLTTNHLFKTIYDLTKQRSLKEKLLGRKKQFSFEIVSTKNQGIRYLIRSHPQSVRNLKKHVLSYLPQAQLQEVDDYLPDGFSELNKFDAKVIEFELAKHFAYPLEKQNILDEHDPVAYITGMMTKLSPGELLSYQMIISPIKTKEADKIKQMIIRGEDTFKYLDRFVIPSYLHVVSVIFKSVNFTITAILSTFGWAVKTILNDASDPYLARRQTQLQYQGQYLLNSVALKQKPARILTTFEQQAVKLVEEKIDQRLFQVKIRLLMVVKDKQTLLEREQGFISSLGVFSGLSEQSLVKKFHPPVGKAQDFLYLNFRKRLLSFVFNSSPMLLSISEVSDLYHFPFSKVTQTENIVKVHSKELPAPLSLKNSPQLDVVFAKNTYGGTATDIGLTKEERVRHMYVIGATGTGKSTMLLSMINQDLKNGKGVCIVDPHGDLAEAAINCIPEDRIKDFIYFNPFDIKYPIGLNLLELTPGLDEDDALLEKEFIAESVISLFRKVFSDAWSAHPHRIEYILRNTIHTAFTLENPTLFTIFELLNNPVSQKKAVQGLQDEDLKNFWKYEFGKAGDYQKVKMVAPVTARIGRFLFSPSARRILEQEKSTISFDEILDSKKILICNLSKGNIGEDTSEVMGIMILNKIQLAALKRARKEQKKRNSFYLYVDEFQNFATPSFVQMLSEARKYGLNLAMAEQSTSQQKDKNLVQIVLANTGTVVTFRSANPQDEDLLLPQYRPYVDFGEIANLPSFHFYMKTAAIRPEEPFSGVTMPVAIKEDMTKREQFIKSSRELYAITYRPKQKKIKIVKAENEQENTSEKVKVRSGVPR